MKTYRIHYVDDARDDHELARYITERELDPYREEDREEIVAFLRAHVDDQDAAAWLHFAPSMADNGLEDLTEEEED